MGASSIFGVGVCAIQGTGTPDSTKRIIYYSVMTPNYSDKRMQMFESPIDTTGTRTYKYRGRYAEFDVMIYLFKYDWNYLAIAGLPSAKTMANTILSYDNQDVLFYPVNTGSAIKDSSGSTVSCHVTDVQFSFLDKVGNTQDICTFHLKTNKFYDITKLLV